MTHICTSCDTIIYYVNKGRWKNAKGNLKKTGKLRCQSCASKEGQLTRKTKPTGRPKGTKNKDNSNIKNNLILFNTIKITLEQRQKAIATRLEFTSYEEYKQSLSTWKRYRNEVDRLTKQQPLHKLENYDKRGPNGKIGAYTLDHIVSVTLGFKNNISEHKIADVSNLRMIPWKDNIIKGWK